MDLDGEWRRRVLLSIVDRPGKVVEMEREDGTLFRCESVHFEGEGLIEVFRRAADDGGDYSVQFALNGEPLAILLIESKRERLFYERDMGWGNRESAEELAHQTLLYLETVITTTDSVVRPR
ncbi:hypothetical protein N9062_01705 [Akkermansiaceae bacterium]|jgi:hypothetical protein|nr:hypothetical protein [Akkermansiaceae bacterium]MDB4465197.1 hypothetical protein [Akkermansiaceae bacterium]MDB4509697.1 hypothetical protein [Akkermansiaceae bacterium]MDF1714412.1 hypothetical protein [Akkermansiaceae bacterium]